MTTRKRPSSPCHGAEGYAETFLSGSQLEEEQEEYETGDEEIGKEEVGKAGTEFTEKKPVLLK